MKRLLEPEPRVPKPPDFDEWLFEAGELADSSGAWAVIGMFFHAPLECAQYLITIPEMWESLLSRGRYADRRRFESGVMFGRRVGL